MPHARAKLTPFGHLLLVRRVEQLQWSVTEAAKPLGISRPTAYKWLARWHRDGHPELTDHSSRPRRSTASRC